MKHRRSSDAPLIVLMSQVKNHTSALFVAQGFPIISLRPSISGLKDIPRQIFNPFLLKLYHDFPLKAAVV
jgi:hypothetical protein